MVELRRIKKGVKNLVEENRGPHVQQKIKTNSFNLISCKSTNNHLRIISLDNHKITSNRRLQLFQNIIKEGKKFSINLISFLVKIN
jgi:hypothetical protein